MNRDLKNKKDVKHLVDEFYKKVLRDENIGFIFTETVAFVWEKHIPKMYDFWDSILFDKATYKGNPMLKHMALNEKIELTDERFDRWLALWKQTIESNFKGEIADKANQKAAMIAELMKYKIKS